MELISKKKLKLRDLENSEPMAIEKKKKEGEIA